MCTARAISCRRNHWSGGAGTGRESARGECYRAPLLHLLLPVVILLHLSLLLCDFVAPFAACMCYAWMGPSALHQSLHPSIITCATDASVGRTDASAVLGKGSVVHAGQSAGDGAASRRGQRHPVGRPMAACDPATERTDRNSEFRNIGK